MGFAARTREQRPIFGPFCGENKDREPFSSVSLKAKGSNINVEGWDYVFILNPKQYHMSLFLLKSGSGRVFNYFVFNLKLSISLPNALN